MNELFLDLSSNATRQYIFELLLEHLDNPKSIKHAQAAAGLSEGHYHDLPEVLSAIENLRVSDRVKKDMRAVYTILAEAEAQVHGCAVDKTHFHEVGNASSVNNALGICLAIEALNPEHIIASSVQVGRGKVVCAHGLLDIPAPATAAILSQGVPFCTERLEGELCTPSSAAIIKHFVDEFRDQR